jgi:RecB family endonuclease NucS
MLIDHCDKVIVMKPDGGYIVENPKNLKEEVNY